MNARYFNACVLLGWLLALVGGCLVHLGGGLLFAGLLLLAVVVIVARAVGIYVPTAEDTRKTDVHLEDQG